MTPEDHDKIEDLVTHFVAKAGRYWHTSDIMKLSRVLTQAIEQRQYIINKRTDHLEEH